MNTTYTVHPHPTVSPTHVHVLSHTHVSPQFLRWLSSPGPSIYLAFFVLEELHVSTFLPKMCTKQWVACQLVDFPGLVVMRGQSCRAEGRSRGGQGRANSRVGGQRREHAHFPTCGSRCRVWGEAEPEHPPGGSRALWALKEHRVIRARPERLLWVLPITMLWLATLLAWKTGRYEKGKSFPEVWIGFQMIFSAKGLWRRRREESDPELPLGLGLLTLRGRDAWRPWDLGFLGLH